MNQTNSAPITSGQWCLVNVSQRKRESFLNYLNNDINKKHLQELILEVVTPKDAIYENMVLIRISNYAEARVSLQQIDHFQSIQRLKISDVSRMLA